MEVTTPRRPLQWRPNLASAREIYTLSGKCSKNNYLVAASLENINEIICLDWSACTCMYVSMSVIHTSIYIYRHRKQYRSNISFELWWRWWHSNFLISAGELHILLCAEKKLIWTSQIEENESSHFCLLLCLLIVICTEVYPTCCLEILQMLEVYISRSQEILVTSSDLKMRMVNFLNLCCIFVLSLW